MKKILGLICLSALGACVDAGQPLVSDYNGRIVKVQYHGFALGNDYQESPIYLKAVETCKLDGRSEAVYQGVRQLGDFAGEHVFLCT